VTGRAAEEDARRERAATALLLLAALGALFSFVDAIGAAMVADPGARVTESWRMYGFVVFAGFSCCWPFGRAAPRPLGTRDLPQDRRGRDGGGACQRGAEDVATVAAADGVLAVVLITAYFLSRG
jgi:hypothetical protein